MQSSNSYKSSFSTKYQYSKIPVRSASPQTAAEDPAYDTRRNSLDLERGIDLGHFNPKSASSGLTPPLSTCQSSSQSRADNPLDLASYFNADGVGIARYSTKGRYKCINDEEETSLAAQEMATQESKGAGLGENWKKFKTWVDGFVDKAAESYMGYVERQEVEEKERLKRQKSVDD
ncbi:hypothetical protein MMC09_006345 [Bachmanniomyces sp. S44760]|nr:hypothetical protein [Bachmanniomyces sp. S44760]